MKEQIRWLLLRTLKINVMQFIVCFTPTETVFQLNYAQSLSDIFLTNQTDFNTDKYRWLLRQAYHNLLIKQWYQVWRFHNHYFHYYRHRCDISYIVCLDWQNCRYSTCTLQNISHITPVEHTLYISESTYTSLMREYKRIKVIVHYWSI